MQWRTNVQATLPIKKIPNTQTAISLRLEMAYARAFEIPGRVNT